ncbi:MFS transporter [Nocardia sp. NBC_01377]|uniref:MFS transporter n=1 Tax=Nocardia sp. NBC_01377 TaxID=2903595 RepID=UPI00386972DA
MNAYTIASVVVLVAAGVLADRHGRRRVFIAAVAGFGITSLLCGLATGVGMLIVGRFGQGAAGGSMMICGLAILSRRFRGSRERARAFGLWGRAGVRADHRRGSGRRRRVAPGISRARTHRRGHAGVDHCRGA